jgi:hypothetical protein
MCLPSPKSGNKAPRCMAFVFELENRIGNRRRVHFTTPITITESSERTVHRCKSYSCCPFSSLDCSRLRSSPHQRNWKSRRRIRLRTARSKLTRATRSRSITCVPGFRTPGLQVYRSPKALKMTPPADRKAIFQWQQV